MILQAFVDDSHSESGDKEFVLAGYMTSAPEWLRFSDEWAFVLSESPKLEHFHSTEARGLSGAFQGWRRSACEEKIDRLIEVIEHHRMGSFDTRLSSESFKKILLPASPHDLKKPYWVLFYAVMANAANQLYLSNISVPIDFIFDEQGEVGVGAALWHGFMKENLPPHLKPLIGSRPIFRDDKALLPLQAADMLAWHLRRSREQRFAGEERTLARLARLRSHGHTETWISNEFLQEWADNFSQFPGIEEVKKHSVKREIAAIDHHISQLPNHEQPGAYEEFNAAMDAILRTDHKIVKAAMETDKKAREEKRIAKAKWTSTSGSASSSQD